MSSKIKYHKNSCYLEIVRRKKKKAKERRLPNWNDANLFEHLINHFEFTAPNVSDEKKFKWEDKDRKAAK